MESAPGIGIIGGGIWAAHHINAIRDLERQGMARLIAVCARTQETVSRLCEQYRIVGNTDYRDLLARQDIDAVCIVTPDHLHREMTVAAARAGKHILVEKPMDLSLKGCDEMLEAARENRVMLFVDFHKRYDPVQQKVRDLICERRVGTIQYGYAYMEAKIIVPRDWLSKWAAHTTPFWFLGSHQVDLLRWTLKSEVRSVLAHSFRGKLEGLGIDTPDAVKAELKFENGTVVTVDVSWILPDGFEAVVNQGLRLVGTEGLIEIDTQDRGAAGCFSGGTMETYNTNAANLTINALGQSTYSGYFIDPIKEFLHLVGYLKDGGDLESIKGKYPSGEDGREATRVAVAVHQSIAKGIPIAVKQNGCGPDV